MTAGTWPQESNAGTTPAVASTPHRSATLLPAPCAYPLRAAAAVIAKEAQDCCGVMLPIVLVAVDRDGNGDSAEPGAPYEPAGPAGRDGAGWRLPHQARAGRGRLRHHLSGRRECA